MIHCSSVGNDYNLTIGLIGGSQSSNDIFKRHLEHQQKVLKFDLHSITIVLKIQVYSTREHHLSCLWYYINRKSMFSQFFSQIYNRCSFSCTRSSCNDNFVNFKFFLSLFGVKWMSSFFILYFFLHIIEELLIFCLNNLFFKSLN